MSTDTPQFGRPAREVTTVPVMLSGLGHTCRVSAVSLAGCLLLVLGAGLVSIGWQSNHALAVVLVLVLTAALGYGLTAAMTRRPQRAQPRR
jgi:hypothetical protein